MKEQAGIQYTIRGVPPEVDRLLRRKSAKRKQSLNQVIVDELAKAVASGQRKADFSEFVGKWSPDPGFDEILASQRKIDGEKWK